MLIRKPCLEPKELYKIDLSQFNIEKCFRKIIYFVDKNEYDLGICKTGKAIQINISATIGSNSDLNRSFGILHKNNSVIKCSVYTYNVIFPNGVDDLMSSQMILNNAYSIDEINDYESNLSSRTELTTYNKCVSTTEGKMDILDSLSYISFNGSNITPPEYYTTEQQIAKEKDDYSIIYLTTIITYEGSELIDPYTSIEIYDLSTWDTMVPALVKNIQEKYINSRNIDDVDSVDLITNMFEISSEKIMNGFMFIYDSQMGVNVRTVKGITSVPMASYRIKDHLIDDLRLMKDLFVAEAKCVEANKGSIRMYFSPLFSGDKLKIYFKDYEENNQPNYNTSKIDKDFTITENVTNKINSLNKIYDDGE